jgi:hypothetical protein
MTHVRSRGASAFRSAGRPKDGDHDARALADAVATRSGTQATPLGGASPGWGAVEELLAGLARTRAVLPMSTSTSSWISSYEPGRRLRLQSDARWSWIYVDHLKSCWETFERLGRIERHDVLEPGRCSAFVMALFARVPGVECDGDDASILVLASSSQTASREH